MTSNDAPADTFIFWFFCAVIMLLVVVLVGLAVVSNVQNAGSAKSVCVNACISFGYQYYNYDIGSYKNNECWCLRNGEPYNIGNVWENR